MAGAQVKDRGNTLSSAKTRNLWISAPAAALALLASPPLLHAQAPEAPGESGRDAAKKAPAARNADAPKPGDASPEKTQPESGQSKGQNPKGTPKKDADPLVQLIRSMTPEQKNHLIENIKAWEQLTPELKQALRAREKSLRKNISDEVDEALQGVNLSAEQRETFEKRYKEERKKLDLALRMELDSRRKASLQEIITRLKQEVAAPQQ
jgi:hypothetical protein